MSVYRFQVTVHLNGGQILETKTFSTQKLDKLQCLKVRLRQPLLGTRGTQNFNQIRCTATEK